MIRQDISSAHRANRGLVTSPVSSVLTFWMPICRPVRSLPSLNWWTI